MKLPAKIILFITSYLPLLLCVIVRQAWGNREYLHYNGISWTSIATFLEKFGLSAILLIGLTLSLVGLAMLFHNIHTNFENGENVSIAKVDNRNSDIISYVITYLLPLLFQSYDSLSDDVCLLIILCAIYPIYINSSMLIVNPTLSLKYSLYHICFTKGHNEYEGVLISKNRRLSKKDNYKIYELNEGIYYGG